ncbi:ATP-NAD kinase family protein [Maledivibacter halophilus]|uniref:Predicted polyphosphate-or ATP-dependent NAD kinase n=1 Tax=Maledivibacter halophilus TaxID=36842 RepID=A0A1T5KPX7_9FIRM|nr:NAD(+)/NADH kinase [Maledivibacter halophilus]SKC65348.1 Predicted polyphosphate-or ATP-dependent NAD kinase [Maledivibacter halophilus]
MIKIGIIANPASGKDIRRLVSHATVVDNNEKVNIVERIALAAQKCGVTKVYIMPDTYQIGYKVKDNLITSGELDIDIEVLKMKFRGNQLDTINAAEIMGEIKVGCIVALGGDGTCRLVAKGIKDIPFIGLSTGTNNVYPKMIEGTVAGMAAAVAASKKYNIKDICKRDKRIEIYKNNKLIDIALVDVVLSKNIFIGAKAIWNSRDILKIMVTRGHPASIGFSSLVGCKKIVKEEDDFGICIDLTQDKYKIKAPIAAGLVEEITLGEPEIIEIDKEYKYVLENQGIIALDGEREVAFNKGDEFTFKITRNGPFHVDIIKTLEIAQKNKFFNI